MKKMFLAVLAGICVFQTTTYAWEDGDYHGMAKARANEFTIAYKDKNWGRVNIIYDYIRREYSNVFFGDREKGYDRAACYRKGWQEVLEKYEKDYNDSNITKNHSLGAFWHHGDYYEMGQVRGEEYNNALNDIEKHRVFQYASDYLKKGSPKYLAGSNRENFILGWNSKACKEIID